MAKDWRIPVCTRHRPIVTLLLVVLVWALAVLSFMTINRRQVERWHAKVAQIKPDMTRSELIRILGEPQLKEKTASIKGLWLLVVNPKEEEKFRATHKEVVAYYYDKAFFLSEHVPRYTVYLDEHEEKTLFEPFLESFLDYGPGQYRFVFIFCLIVLAVLVWLAVRSWCRTKLREPLTPSRGHEIRK